jgi:hypothetical protein
MEESRAIAHTDLEREVSELLLRWERAAIPRLDELLADCAAEAVRLSVAAIRADRELDATLTVEAASGSWSKQRRALFIERKRISAELCHIETLMGSLRLHRDRLARY